MAAPKPDVSKVCGRSVGKLKISTVSCNAASLCTPPPTPVAYVWVHRLFLDVLATFTQSIGNAFEHGAVHMCSGMHIAKANECALGFWTGIRMPGDQ